MKLIKYTPEGLNNLKAQIAQIQQSRPAAVKELTRAREMGDLSENGLYTAAKGRLRSMDSNLRRLTYQMKLAQVVASQKYIVEENGKKIEYLIVGDFEADPLNHKISANSPIGVSLKNAKVGDSVIISTPKGSRTLKVIDIK